MSVVTNRHRPYQRRSKAFLMKKRVRDIRRMMNGKSERGFVKAQREDVGFTSILGHVVFRSCSLMEVARGCSRRQSRVNVCTTFFREWRRVLTLGVVPPAVFACDVLVLACDVLMSKDEVESQQCSERCEAGPILLEEQDLFLRCPDSRDVFI